MKLKNILSAAIFFAGALLLGSCNMEEPIANPSISVDKVVFDLIPKEGGDVVVNLSSTVPWRTEVEGEGFTVSPSSGDANVNAVPVTIHADAWTGDEPRSAQISFLTNYSVSTGLTVKQEGALDLSHTYTPATAVSAGKAYLFVANDDGTLKAAAPLEAGKSYGYLPYEVVAPQADGSIKLADGSLGFILEDAGNGKFYLVDESGRYYYRSGTYKSFNVATAPREDGIFTIVPNGQGGFKLTCPAGYWMQFSSGYGSWGIYDSVNGIDPVIYEDSKEVVAGDKLVADATEKTVLAGDTAVEFAITANVDWKASISEGADWVKTFTESGSGDGSFKVTFDEYTGTDADRTAKFTLIGGEKTLNLSVIQQKVVTIVPATIAEFNALPEDNTGTYQIGGVINDVTYSGSAGKYGNFHIEDHTGVAYIYGLLPEEGGKGGQSVPEALGLKNGDFISVAAPHSSHNGAPQAKNAWPLAVYPYKTVEEFNALDDSDEARYTLKVEVTKITNTTYGNFEFKDATGTGVTYTTYDFDGTYKAFANLGLEEGDIITFHALKTTYKGTIQAKNCQPILIEKASAPQPQESADYTKVNEITEADAAAKGFVIASKEGDVWHVAKALAETKTYGYLPYVDVTANADGSLTITDPACIWILSPAPNCWYIQDVYGRYLYMTGSYNSFNVSKELPASGAEWTIENRSDGTVSILCDDTGKTIQFDTQYGSWGSYPDERAIFPGVFSGAREISGGGEPTPGPGPSNPGGSGTLADPYNVDGAIAFIKAGGDKETSEVYVKGKVSSIKYPFDAQHGTATFNISADGSATATQFTAYSVYYLGNRAWAEGDTQVAVGDDVVLYGKLTNYQGTYETSNKKAFVYSLNGKSEGGVEPTPGPGPDDPEPAGDTQSVNWPEYFNTTENIEPLETYTIDGVKYSFDKNGANTNPRYWASASAVRLYNKNAMTVTAPEGKVITQIEFTDVADNGGGAAPTCSSGAWTPNKWMGKAGSVTLTFAGHMYHGGIKVTLADGSASEDPVCINEVWPANDKVELFNPASSEADITGWTLTNGSESYTIPASKGKVAAGDHVSFSLAVNGTEGFVIVLKDASGAQISKVSNSGATMVPLNEARSSKESYGCVVDGVNTWVVFSHHSIGTANENGEIEIRGLKGVKEAVPMTDQTVTLIDPVVTYADSRYAVIQEGKYGALLDKSGHGYATADLFEGFVEADVTANVTNQNLVLTACSFVDNTKTRASELPAENLTIAQVKSRFADLLMNRVILNDVKVTKTAQVGDNGAIAQGTDTVQVVTLVPVEFLAEGAEISKLVAFPYYATGKKQALLVFELAEQDVASLGASVDLSPTEVNIPAGATFNLTATTTSPERIQYYSTTPAVAEVTPSGAVTGVSQGEAEIVAYVKSNGLYPYAEARCLVTVGEALPPAAAGTISDIKAAYNGSSATEFSIALSGALVTYVSGSNFYLEDATGAILGYTSGHGLQAGDMVSGTISGKVTKYQGNFEITNFDKTMATITGGNTVTPTEVPIATLAANFADYESKYVQVSNVTVASVSGKNITLSEDGSVIIYSNQNGTLPTASTVINVRGLVTYYNATKEVKFFSIANDLDIVSTGGGSGPATVTFSQPTGAAATAGCSFTVSAGGSVISSGANVASGTTVTLTATAGTGYDFTSWTVTGATVVSATAGTTTFTMGTSPVTISATFTPASGGGSSTVASVNIGTYASSNSWTNSTKYTSLSIDSNVTATVSGGGNTGKYYTDGNQWRMYQSENASITINAGKKTITSVTITYAVTNGGTLKNGTATVSSGAAQSPNASSVTYTVGNTGTKTNGQVRITAISVSYQ